MMIRLSIALRRNAVLGLAAMIAITISSAGCAREQGQTGFYVILADAQGVEGLPKPAPDQQIARYDQKYLREAGQEPTRYLLLRKKPDVALKLARPPESGEDSRGFTTLSIELTKEAAMDLERVSRDNLGKKVAFVIEGEPVTIHKIRSVITGGQFQLSRCTDNACEYIRSRLTQ